MRRKGGRRNVDEEKCWRALTLEARAAVAALLTTAQTFRRPYCDRSNHVKRVTGDGRVHQRLCHRRVSSSVCDRQVAESQFVVASPAHPYSRQDEADDAYNVFGILVL